MFRSFAISLAALVILTACGEKVEVPPANVGVVLDKSGYKPDFLPPSRFRLPVCWPWEACPELVLMQAADKQLKESMDLFMPKSQLKVKDIEVRFTVSVTKDKKVLRRILDRVIPNKYKSGQRVILLENVYTTYVQERVRAIVRQVLAEHKIEEIAANREAIGTTIFLNLRTQLTKIGAPVQVTQFSLARFNPPEVILKAYSLAEERKIDLQKAEADKDVKIKEAEARLAVERKEAEVRLAKARAFLEEAKIMSVAATPQWLEMRRLEVMERMATNKNAVFFPFGSHQAALNIKTLQAVQAINK